MSLKCMEERFDDGFDIDYSRSTVDWTMERWIIENCNTNETI